MTPGTAVAPIADDPLAFDFEAPLDTTTWTMRNSSDAMSVDASVAHGGRQSLRLRAASTSGGFVATQGAMPLAEARGHRLAVSAWLRTELSSGWAGLWCRVDGPERAMLSFDNMEDRPVTGTTGWTRVTVRVIAPPSTDAVLCGSLVVGSGDVWLDDLAITREGAITDEEFRAPVTVAGVVVDGDKQPLPGMTIRASQPTDDRPVLAGDAVTTASDGSFELRVPPSGWAYDIVATSPTVAAGVRSEVKVAPLAAVRGLEVRAGGRAHVVSGRVRSLGGKPVAGVLAGVSEMRPGGSMPLFLVESDAKGAYQIALPPGHYTQRVLGVDGLTAPPASFDLAKNRRLDLRFAPRVELAVDAPAAVVDWVKSNAVPLATAEAGRGVDDLDGFAPAIGKARIVAVGEATHGTREFSQLKHRMLEYLVMRHGFSVFAIESQYGEVTTLNDYVVDGKGDMDAALASIFGIWKTEEVRAMIEWMRTWNADPAHTTKLRVYGVDVQESARTYAAALAYLQRVDPDEAKRVAALLAPLGADLLDTAYRALPAVQRKGIRDGIAALLVRFDRERVRYAKTSSAREHMLARQHVNVLRQHELLLDPPPGEAGYVTRDKGMAENIAWIVETAEPGARVVFWAHNGHISRTGYDGWTSVGERTAKRYGRAYLSIGFLWNQGGFRASSPDGKRLHTVGPESKGGLGATLARAAIPLFALDLRRAPKGVVRAWFDAPHFTRDIGATYTTDINMEGVFYLSRQFDAVLFVDTTSAPQDIRR